MDLQQNNIVSAAGATRLSFAQQRLWVLHQLHPNFPQIVSTGIRLKGSLNIEALEKALAGVASRHEILRCVFRRENGEPKQVVFPAARIPLKIIELSGNSPSENETNAAHCASEQSERPFDLDQGPLIRALLLQLASEEFVFLISTHRIVCDERSAELLLDEVVAFYNAVVSGESSPRSEPLQYRDFADGQRAALTHELAQQLAHWKHLLSGAATSIDLPTDRPRPAIQTFRGARREMVIPVPLVHRLQGLSQVQNVTLFVTLLTAFNVLLSRYSRQYDIVIGTSVAGRHRPELKTLIGPLENMLVIRTDTSGDVTFSELLFRVKETTESAYGQQSVPFGLLVEELHLERDMSRHPLFQVVFSLEESLRCDCKIPGLTVSPFKIERLTERFDLSVKLARETNGLRAIFSYNADLFDATTIDRMMGHFTRLLESVAATEGQKVSELPLLTETERRQVLVEWNNTTKNYPTTCVHSMFEAQVDKTPEAVAVVFDGKQLTYAELNRRANQLAHYLRQQGVVPGGLVGISTERSLDMVVAVVATLKAGAAYVPLDPTYPRDRLAFMLRDSGAALLLTQQRLASEMPSNAAKLVCVDSHWPEIAKQNTENMVSGVTPKNLVYVIYTSGSTGKPKGVRLPHRALTNLLFWQLENSYLPKRAKTLQYTSLNFDVSFQEIFATLCSGGVLVLVSDSLRRDAVQLLRFLSEQNIARLFLPFVALQQLADAANEGDENLNRGLREVVTAGEQLKITPQLVKLFRNMPQCRLYNQYGPSESHVVTSFELTGPPETWETLPPIGKPIANTQVYILDSHLRPVPVGGSGELYIGGVALADGYLNRPELTTERFIADLFRPTAEAQLYRTGDLVRYRPNGNIEYLGRTDHQVKLRGFRIELGEIEAVLGKCAGVRQAAVAVREDIPGDKRLVAYLVRVPGHELDIRRIRASAKETLPEYMVPSKFAVLEKFPMTASGKVDRKALPVPPTEPQDAARAIAPRDELESELVSIFQEILGVPSVGVSDNFFDLGGHSLLAARLVSQVAKIAGREIPLSVLFRRPTVESLACWIREGSDSSPDPVVMLIQPGKGGLPFFAIVPPGEESMGYAMLARHMGPDQAVYKIQRHAPSVGKRPYTEQEMRSMASEYAAAIRSAEPEGPYCLGGLCDGTHIAEQVVLELERAGHEVGLFAIFDTWVLQNSQRPWVWWSQYYQQRLRDMRKQSLMEQLRFYRRGFAILLGRFAGKASFRTAWQETYWPENYTPSRFHAQVVLFKRPKQPHFYIKDPQMGWGGRTESGVEIIEINFNHAEILREPHVRVLGEKLATCIGRVNQRRLKPPLPVREATPVLSTILNGQSH